jgi:hypothetical protein
MRILWRTLGPELPPKEKGAEGGDAGAVDEEEDEEEAALLRFPPLPLPPWPLTGEAEKAKTGASAGVTTAGGAGSVGTAAKEGAPPKVVVLERNAPGINVGFAAAGTASVASASSAAAGDGAAAAATTAARMRSAGSVGGGR